MSSSSVTKVISYSSFCSVISREYTSFSKDVSDRRTALWSGLEMEKVWEGFEEGESWVTVSAEPGTVRILIKTREKTLNIEVPEI